LAQANKGASLQVGQTLELALPFGHHWALAPSSTSWQSTLTLDTPAGYGDTSLQSCVWRFTAKRAGEALIAFTFTPNCKPPMECPQIMGFVKVAVTVG
jgi:hypothetical protein